MPSHKEIFLSPFSVDEMFAVVADVEKYPEFVPGCAALKIVERESEGDLDTITAQMLVSFGTLREKYTSKVTINRKESVIEACHIDGPFDHLDTRWRFIPVATGSEIQFFIDFAFSNQILAAASSFVFDAIAHKTTDAFVTRAERLYGGSHHAQQ